MALTPEHSIQKKALPMVDLQGQYLAVKQEIDEAVLACISEGAFINGPQVAAFKQDLGKYLGVAHVIPCANGTDALQLAFMALGLKAGDEVIVPAFTYAAVAEVLLLLGLKPVWVDVQAGSFNIDPAGLKAAVTPNTKAIVPVHLFGQCSDMESILAFAKEHNLFVVEDNAQSIGAVYTFRDGKRVMSGVAGTIGCTSFFPSKNLGCYGDGGAVYTNDPALAAKLRMIANHGQAVKYHHEVIGINSRLDTIQAAILQVKLRYLDRYISARSKAADTYDVLLSGIKQLSVPERTPGSTHVFHQYTLRIHDGSRDALKKHLEAQGISTMIYYPLPAYTQKAYYDAAYPEGSFPVASALCDEVLSLPMHTELNDEVLNYIAGRIKAFYSE